MATVARLKVLLEADGRKMQSALHRMRKGVFSLQNAVIGLAGAGGFAGMIKAQLNAADDMQKFSDRIGISTEALSELRHAAKLSGIPIATLQMAMQRMTRRVGEFVSTGAGPAAKAFQELGITTATLKGLKPEVQLEVIADALAGVEDASLRAALAQKVFDSEGVAMLQMMKRGSIGIKEMRGQAQSLGLTLNRSAADAAARANDAMTNLQATVGALAQAFALQLAPGIAKGLEELTYNLPNIMAAVTASFKTVGRVIGNIAATGGAILSGNFAGAADIGSVGFGDIYQQALDESMPETAKNTGETNVLLREIRDNIGNGGAVAQ